MLNKIVKWLKTCFFKIYENLALKTFLIFYVKIQKHKGLIKEFFLQEFKGLNLDKILSLRFLRKKAPNIPEIVFSGFTEN